MRAALLRQHPAPGHHPGGQGGRRPALPAHGGGEEIPFHPFLPEDVGELERLLLADLAATTGVPTEMLGISDLLSWTLARRLLTWVSRNTSVDKEIIKAFLQDVAVYLSHGRKPVLDEVRRLLPPRATSCSSPTAWGRWWPGTCSWRTPSAAGSCSG
ncbi:hypothetical protein ACFQ0B_12185 [Nonomuraea thailandensis]